MKDVIVVGGGLAGLSCAMRLAEKGCHVKIISLTKVKRSHSVCAQGGINAAINLKNEDDSPYIHTYDTIKGGAFLADQPPVLEMCLAAPGIIRMMERFGCPFNRTPEGYMDFRRFGGTLYNRTAFCGTSTGQQLLYALDEQVRRYESRGSVEKYEHHDFLRLVIDDEGRARGIVMMDLNNLKIEVLKSDAVVFGIGGNGVIFKKTSNSTFCTGAANGRLFTQGMHYANGEFIQIHPTAIPGDDKMRLISESVRGEGGRVWVYGDSTKSIVNSEGKTVTCGKTGEPWYFLEELYPALGNLVPRDIASREILRVCDLGLGADGQHAIFLDVRHFSEEKFKRTKSVLDIYRKYTGEDPRHVPMRLYVAVHYTMGGAWVDWPACDAPDRAVRFRQMTNIPGCFQVGESEFAFHGANRLGANALVACLFAGLVAGNEVPRYLETLQKSYSALPSRLYAEEMAKEEVMKHDLLTRSGRENVHKLHDELADVMMREVTVRRNNPGLMRAMTKIKEIRERFHDISLDDRGTELNQTFAFASQFGAMLEIALVITKGALSRDESRGSHYKEDFPEQDDKRFLKTTLARHGSDEPEISYLPVDLRHLEPVQREYVHAKKVKPELKNLPKAVELPV